MDELKQAFREYGRLRVRCDRAFILNRPFGGGDYDRLCEIEMTKDVTLVVWSDDINGSLTFGSYMCQNFGGSNAQMFAYMPRADLQRYADRYSNYFDFPNDASPFS